MHLRHLIIASAFLIASGITGSVPAQNSFSQNTDRPGGDYRSFDINGDAEACRETCDARAAMPRMELRQGSEQLARARTATGPLLAEDHGSTGPCQSVLHVRRSGRPKNRPG